MKKIMMLVGLVCLPMFAQAADMANGERINRKCALCHGVYGQGTPGRLSPRLAGFPKWYLEKATKEFQEGKLRHNPLMVKTSGLDHMTDADIEDVSAYLASLDISPDRRFDIIMPMGNPARGEEIFKDDCKTCHAKDGYGKPKKEAPPIAGQHHEYLFSTIKLFQSKLRNHDNDPEDETFDDFSDADLVDILAYLSTLDNQKVRVGYHFFPPRISPIQMARVEKQARERKSDGGLEITDIKQTVAKMALEEGVSIDDAIQAMKAKANELNLRQVGEQFVSKELESRGVETPYLTILQFCDPMDARLMIISNPIFASYMPCRIAIVEDQDKKPWLMMLNLDMLINSELLPDELVETAIRVNQNMLDVMVAGSTGEF